MARGNRPTLTVTEARSTPGVSFTFKAFSCGCRFEGAGTLPDPLRIEACEGHFGGMYDRAGEAPHGLHPEHVAAAHRFVVHRDGSPCEDGCDRGADPIGLATYNALGLPVGPVPVYRVHVEDGPAAIALLTSLGAEPGTFLERHDEPLQIVVVNLGRAFAFSGFGAVALVVGESRRHGRREGRRHGPEDLLCTIPIGRPL